MKASLQLKQSQQLSLTPQLQQSLRMLQMSSLELTEEIERILTDNPLLEKIDHDDTISIQADGSLDTSASHDLHTDDATKQPDHDSLDQDNTLTHDETHDAPNDFDISELSWEGHGQTNLDDDEQDNTATIANQTTLRDHLYQQLAGHNFSHQERTLIELWIDALDERGLVTLTSEELHAMLPAELNIDLDDINIAKRLLQSLDPIGIGAATLQESFSLQLKAKQAPANIKALTQTLIEHHLHDCANKNFKYLTKHLHCDENTLKQAIVLLQTLDPFPAREFAGKVSDYVIADIVIEKQRGHWTAKLNHKALPHIKLNDVYSALLQHQSVAKKTDPSQANELQHHMQEAKHFLRSIEQRYLTILRVAEFIVKHQKSFFSQGAVAMKPLIAKEVALALELHESTISRVIQQKYMQTPHGLFELKYFFSSQVATDAGGNASSTAIKALLQQFITKETPKKPLSDQRLVELLEAEGMIVARRTVAKYREQLGFPPAHLRKTL